LSAPAIALGLLGAINTVTVGVGSSNLVSTCPVTYSWSGVLPPVNADGTSVFKAGSTIPVKFALTAASAGITTLQAKFSATQVSSSVSGLVNKTGSTSKPTSGNLFRYDPTTGQYVYNWGTKGLSSGTYQLQIDLGDGVSRTVSVQLR
jgi:hypothetical protein